MAIEFKYVTEDDHEFLYDLLIARPLYANISHKRLPGYEKHCKFVRSNPYQVWYIIKEGDSKIGTAYLTENNEIGIQIKSIFQRMGFAEYAIKHIMKEHGPGRFLANIAPDNSISQKLFKKLGFKFIQKTFERIV